MTRGTCTVLFLPSSTRTLISLETHYLPTVGWLTQMIYPCSVRWLWQVPHQTTSRFSFRTLLVVPLWMLLLWWSYSMWWAWAWDPLSTSVRLFRSLTWIGLCVETTYLDQKTPVLLVGDQPNSAEMAEYQWHQVPGMRRVNKSEYVTPSTTPTHDLPVLLALPCSQLPDVVRLGIIWKRWFGTDI